MVKKRGGPWPVSSVVKSLIATTGSRDIEPARVGRLLGSRRSKDPNAERQSFYDIRDGRKRLWINDAERWASDLLRGRVMLSFTDPWDNAIAAVRAIPGMTAEIRAVLVNTIEQDRTRRARARPSEQTEAV